MSRSPAIFAVSELLLSRYGAAADTRAEPLQRAHRHVRLRRGRGVAPRREFVQLRQCCVESRGLRKVCELRQRCGGETTRDRLADERQTNLQPSLYRVREQVRLLQCGVDALALSSGVAPRGGAEQKPTDGGSGAGDGQGESGCGSDGGGAVLPRSGPYPPA